MNCEELFLRERRDFPACCGIHDDEIHARYDAPAQRAIAARRAAEQERP